MLGHGKWSKEIGVDSFEVFPANSIDRSNDRAVNQDALLTRQHLFCRREREFVPIRRKYGRIPPPANWRAHLLDDKIVQP
jgi:hypothetical protein